MRSRGGKWMRLASECLVDVCVAGFYLLHWLCAWKGFVLPFSRLNAILVLLHIQVLASV